MREAETSRLAGWPPFPVRIALMFASMFFITGISTPFLPVWFASCGFTVAEIGLLSTLPQLVRSFVAPAIGFEADRRHAHRDLVVVLTTVGMAAWLLLSQTSGFALAFAAMLMVALSNTAAPLVETIAMAGVRTHGHDYGRMRLWGSAAFVAANLLAGTFATRFGPSAIIAMLVTGSALACTVSLFMPRMRQPDAQTPRKPLTIADARALLHIPQMALVLLAAGAVQGAHGMFYAYGTLHWQTQGYNPSWFGALWAVGLITEIALFWWSTAAVRRFGATELMIFGAGLSVLRWVMMAFDPPLLVLVPLQICHGLTFGASHLGAMHVLTKIAPTDRAATAQALYALVSTLGSVTATAVAARLYPLAGGATYLAMALMAAISLAAAMRVRSRIAAAISTA